MNLNTPPSKAPTNPLRIPRMADWLLASVLLAALVFFIAPHQLPVSLYKLSLVAMAGVAGYWIDRSMFPYARPDAFLVLDDPEPETLVVCEDIGGECALHSAPDTVLLQLMGQAMLRRAIIVAAAMVSVGLGA